MANITFKFGLLGFPAKLGVATVTKESMTTLCVGQGETPHAPSATKMPRTCEICGPIVDTTVLVKGIKEGSSYAIVTQEELADVAAEFASEHKEVDLVPHPVAEFNLHTAPKGKLYYITPADAGGADHYQLMVKLISEHPELAFASLYTPGSVTALFQIVVREGVLMLQERSHGDALRPAPSVGGNVNEALYGMLDGSLSMFVTPYDPEAYEDRYAVALAAMAESAEHISLEGEKKTTRLATVTDADIMEKLRALKAAS